MLPTYVVIGWAIYAWVQKMLHLKWSKFNRHEPKIKNMHLGIPREFIKILCALYVLSRLMNIKFLKNSYVRCRRNHDKQSEI